MGAQDLFDYLPRYYHESRVVGNIIARESEEFTKLNDDIRDVLDQYFVDTATWGLAIWERICGIATDESKPTEQRRSVIKSKLRGMGTVTVDLITNVAESFTNGEVEATEDYANYTVVVRYVSTVGVPDNIADIEAALREIIPAHLAIQYEYRYLFVNQVHEVMTIDDVQTTRLNRFAPFREVL